MTICSWPERLCRARIARIQAAHVATDGKMQALIDLISGLLALLAASALAQFGVEIQRPADNQPEVRRLSDCSQPAGEPTAFVAAKPEC